MTHSKKISRRRMLKRTLGAAGAGIALPMLVGCPPKTAPPSPPPPQTTTQSPPQATSPNEQIGIGIIGCGRRNAQLQIGRGGQGEKPAGTRIVAVADFNKNRADQWAAKHQAEAYQDYRKLLDNKNVDVIIYATPEHWHYLPCIHACQAGKDIYGEQPLGHTIREGQLMVKAVRKYNRIFQTGEQQRSNAKTRKAAELIRNGRIGKVQSIIGYNYPSPFECGLPEQPIPEGLDWDRWCGPNPLVPYNVNLYLSRIPYEREWLTEEEKNAVGPGWMSFRPYSGGELVNWGCHGLSMVQWAMDLDRSGPSEIWVEPAEKLEAPVCTTPEQHDVGDALTDKTIINYRFPNDVVLSLSGTDKKLGGGATFIGEKGKITIFRGGYECDPKDLDKEPLPADAVRLYESDNHMANFFECVRSRKDPIMDVETAHRVATLCHLGNIARWLGRSAKWDPEKEEFPGDEEANKYLDFERRKGYELPTEV